MAKRSEAKPLNEPPPRWGRKGDPEELDPTPMEMPLGHCRPTPIHELIARAVHQEMSQKNDEGYETFEEANDFEMDDVDDVLMDMTPYELNDMQDEYLVEDAERAAASSEGPGSEVPDQPEAESGEDTLDPPR